ncbi:MAG: hypothetical protein IJ699_07800 [Bacteroidaceae bacterium]|nr:hypothetical protein [Bacteroidaceae bacterium]
MKPKRLWSLTLLLLINTFHAAAQQLLITDDEGNPVGFAHVLNHNGTVLSVSNLDGTADLTPMSDQIEGKPVTITHVAFKPRTINIDPATTGTRTVALEETDFDMPELTVTPKDFIYVQTYYRVLYMRDDTVTYYRAGLVDNVYDVKKKKLNTDSRHFSKAEIGLLKVLINKLAGSTIESYAELSIPSGKREITSTPAGPGRTRLDYHGVDIGTRIQDFESHQLRTSIDMEALAKQKYKEEGKEKKLKRMEEDKNVVNNRTIVYQMDDEGKSTFEDFMMSEWHNEFDSYSRANKKYQHVIIWLESYNVDRAYVTKKELKERKAQNRREMNLDSMRQLEQERGVPALAPQLQRRLDVLFKKAKD